MDLKRIAYELLKTRVSDLVGSNLPEDQEALFRAYYAKFKPKITYHQIQTKGLVLNAAHGFTGPEDFRKYVSERLKYYESKGRSESFLMQAQQEVDSYLNRIYRPDAVNFVYSIHQEDEDGLFFKMTADWFTHDLGHRITDFAHMYNTEDIAKLVVDNCDIDIISGSYSETQLRERLAKYDDLVTGLTNVLVAWIDPEFRPKGAAHQTNLEQGDIVDLFFDYMINYINSEEEFPESVELKAFPVYHQDISGPVKFTMRQTKDSLAKITPKESAIESALQPYLVGLIRRFHQAAKKLFDESTGKIIVI